VTTFSNHLKDLEQVLEFQFKKQKLSAFEWIDVFFNHGGALDVKTMISMAAVVCEELALVSYDRKDESLDQLSESFTIKDLQIDHNVSFLKGPKKHQPIRDTPAKYL
jgi:hypothetical protein